MDQTTRPAERRDYPDLRYTAVLQAEEEYAHVRAHFLFYWHEAWTADDREAPLFWREGSGSNVDCTEDPAEAEPDGELWVKWDGCGSLEIPNRHFCERAHLEHVAALLLRLHDWARDLGMDR